MTRAPTRGRGKGTLTKHQRLTRTLERSIAAEAKRLKAIAFADPIDLFDDEGRFLRPDELPPHVRVALAYIKVGPDGRICGFRFKDKVKALGRLLSLADPGFPRD